MAQLTSPTLTRLLKEVRLVLRQQNNKNSNWNDDELTVYLNDGVRRYFVEIANQGSGQFDATTDLNIVSGSETVSLPTDCFEVKALYKLQNNIYQILPYKNNLTESYDTLPTTSSTLYTPYYYFRGNTIVLRPVPNFNETAGLRLEYTLFPESMIWGGDTLTNKISPVFKELIVMYAVYKAKISSDLNNGGDTATKALELLSKLEYQFKETVGDRSKFPKYTIPFIPGGNW